MKTETISLKGIGIFLLITAGFIAIFFIINSIDNKKLYTSFLKMNETINTSAYTDSLNNYLSVFTPTDTVLIKKIMMAAGKVERENEDISSCYIYVSYDGLLYKISGNEYGSSERVNMNKLNGYSRDIAKAIKVLEQKEGFTMKDLYNVTANKDRIWTLVKLTNGYAELSKRRD